MYSNVSIRFKNHSVNNLNLKVLMYHDGPKMLVDENQEYLFVYYDFNQDILKEIWFLINNKKNIKLYLTNGETLRNILLEGPTFLVSYDFEDDSFIVHRELDREDLQNNFKLPAKDSYFKS